MEKLEKKISVSLTDELVAWLESKVTQGYKKASLIRRALQIYMDCEANAEKSEREECRTESEEGDAHGGLAS